MPFTKLQPISVKIYYPEGLPKQLHNLGSDINRVYLKYLISYQALPDPMKWIAQKLQEDQNLQQSWSLLLFSGHHRSHHTQSYSGHWDWGRQLYLMKYLNYNIFKYNLRRWYFHEIKYIISICIMCSCLNVWYLKLIKLNNSCYAPIQLVL